MVEQLDIERLTYVSQSQRCLDVMAAWATIARWMIVRDDDSRRAELEGPSKQLSQPHWQVNR